ncbi:M23 family metallopeptidase [uncultured Sunxiuqinia sp.]|uniref:M23 family metallopeptidase n=1 Tax=uncultured Sunxiuqinia sp. TaxID=1573825 RepID=UPI002AA921FF|nr:M23 family metallopeptidase [uncultured Sunxiuqinia sp.]
MAKKEKKKKLIEKLKNRYRLIIYNDSTYQTAWSIKLTRLKVFTFFGIGGLLLVLFTILMIAYTPIREFIPGYPSSKVRQLIVHNAVLVDSLEEQLHIRDNYFDKIRILIEGDVPQDPDFVADTAIPKNNLEINYYNHDSVFKQKILEEQLNLSIQKENPQSRNIANIHFFVPLKGMITNKFNVQSNHRAVDVVGLPNSRISAVLDGTVIFAGWTAETGYVIYLQHESDLVSVYKHNAELLKDVGDKVKAGEAIAIMGNTGELTTGPHLHFELWNRGIAIDPEKYIDF